MKKKIIIIIKTAKTNTKSITGRKILNISMAGKNFHTIINIYIMSLSKAKTSIAFNFLFSQDCFIHVLVRCTKFPKVNKFFMFRVSIIHIVITWPSRNQVSFHTRPRLLHTFSPIRAVTGWFTLVPLHTITVVSISLKKQRRKQRF